MALALTPVTGESYINIYGRDITERKRMEAAVRESEARLSAIVDNAPNAISLKDRRGRYLLINRVFEKMLDTTSEEVRGKTSREIFPREFAESGVAHDRAVVEKRRAIELGNPSSIAGIALWPLR